MSEADELQAEEPFYHEGAMERPEVYLLNSPLINWPLFVRWPTLRLHDVLADGGESLPLPRPLRRQLHEWRRFFHQHYAENRSWDTPENILRYNAVGIDLANRIATTIGGSYRVLVYLEGGHHAGWTEVLPQRAEER